MVGKSGQKQVVLWVRVADGGGGVDIGGVAVKGSKKQVVLLVCWS